MQTVHISHILHRTTVFELELVPCRLCLCAPIKLLFTSTSVHFYRGIKVLHCKYFLCLLHPPVDLPSFLDASADTAAPVEAWEYSPQLITAAQTAAAFSSVFLEMC